MTEVERMLTEFRQCRPAVVMDSLETAERVRSMHWGHSSSVCDSLRASQAFIRQVRES
jgi:hypothetical protein